MYLHCIDHPGASGRMVSDKKTSPEGRGSRTINHSHLPESPEGEISAGFGTCSAEWLPRCQRAGPYTSLDEYSKYYTTYFQKRKMIIRIVIILFVHSKLQTMISEVAFSTTPGGVNGFCPRSIILSRSIHHGLGKFAFLGWFFQKIFFHHGYICLDYLIESGHTI